MEKRERGRAPHPQDDSRLTTTGEVGHTDTAPEVRQGPIADNQKAFFLGLAIGGFQIEGRFWHGTTIPFVTITTEARRPKYRELLAKTIGQWGHTRATSYQQTTSLHAQTFDFLLHPRQAVTSDFLRAKGRFASILYA